MIRRSIIFICLMLAALPTLAQTPAGTTPVRWVSALPTKCEVNKRPTVLLYKYTLTRGLYYCSSTNTWTLITAGGVASPLTTKGDIWGFTSANARVPVGTDGQVLTANSAQPTGLEWATGFVRGSGTTNYLTRWTDGAAGVIGDTPLSWNNTTYDFNKTSGGAAFKMFLTPGAALGSGSFRVGHIVGSGGSTYLELLGTSGVASLIADEEIDIEALTAIQNLSTEHKWYNRTGTGNFRMHLYTESTGLFEVGNYITGSAPFVQLRGSDGFIDLIGNSVRIGGLPTSGDRTLFIVNNSAKTFTFSDTNGAALMDLTGVNNFQLQRTNTAGGTTGARTIDKPNGSVNFAASATTLVVTNSTVATTSNIIAAAQTNDTTCSVKDVEPGSGSFTIRMTAACTAETRVAFWVFN